MKAQHPKRMIARLLTLISISTLGVGCIHPYVAPVAPTFSAITIIESPLDVDFNETKIGSKKGESTVTTILFVAFGDASAATAARNGGITTIRHADYRFLNILGLYSTFTTVVHGD